jgi:hypothetical protein
VVVAMAVQRTHNLRSFFHDNRQSNVTPHRNRTHRNPIAGRYTEASAESQTL